MPIAKFQMPDGRIARFEVPEGTTPEQVTAFAEQHFAAQSKPTEYSVAPDSTAGKVMQTLDKVEATPYIGPLVKGARDATKGGAQLLAHGINAVAPSILSDEELQNIDNDVRVSEQKYQAARQAREPQSITSLVTGQQAKPGIDWGRMAGGMAVTAPLLPFKAASLPVTIAKSAGTSGAISALQPITTGDDYWKEKGKGIAIGSTVGAAVPLVGAGLSRVISPQTSSEVQTLMKEGVTPTPGQILGGWWSKAEDKMTSLPIIGDSIKAAQRRAVDQLNAAAYNRALNPIGLQAKDVAPEVGRSGVDAVRQSLGKAYDDLLPKLSFKADTQFSQDMNKLFTMAQTLPPEQAGQFQKIMRDQVIGRMTPQGNMSGETLKAVESELSRLARGYRGDPSFGNKQLGSALDEVLASIREGLQRSNPSHAQQLADINRGFANYTRIRDAAGRVGSQDGIFTAAQLQAAVRAADKSAGKGKFATGKAPMQDLSDAGKKVLGNAYPDSGTAGRLMGGPAGGLASYFINPAIPAGLLGGAALYSRPAQRAIGGLLTQRPASAKLLSNGVDEVSPLLGPVITAGLLSNR